MCLNSFDSLFDTIFRCKIDRDSVMIEVFTCSIDQQIWHAPLKVMERIVLPLNVCRPTRRPKISRILSRREDCVPHKCSKYVILPHNQ